MIEHAQLVRDLKKPAEQIANDITPTSLDLIHMIMGISGEAGELLDAIKKATIYNKPIDVPNIIEELGDLEFYMEGLRQILGISRSDVLDKNIAKLRVRYGQKYSDKSAQDRVDKLPDISMSDIRQSVADDTASAKYREALLAMDPRQRDALMNGKWEPETDISNQ